MKDVLDKLADFFINLGVAAAGIGLFQGDLDKMIPCIASLLIATSLSLIK